MTAKEAPMFDNSEWRKTKDWPAMLRVFAQKLLDEKRDWRDGYYALLMHSADEIEALRASSREDK